jgi:hypothetical protein
MHSDLVLLCGERYIPGITNEDKMDPRKSTVSLLRKPFFC